MHIVSRKALLRFIARYDDSAPSLNHWFRVTKKVTWSNFAGVRESFGSADPVGHYVVFNISGNKYRLIVDIHYNKGRVYIDRILTHEEYDRWTREQR